jgi:predicted alpha/beta superfamily hydrolase
MPLKTYMYKIFKILFIIIIVPQNLSGQDKIEVAIGKKYSIHSDILNEDRSYWIHLPNSYTEKVFSPKKYPVLILLDGDAHFHSATGIIQFLGSNGKIPEMIVVGIPNTDRTRDLTPTHCLKAFDGKETDHFKNTGGGDNFLGFVHEELLPKIDSSYRTLPYKILVGHSLGGILAIHSFLSEKKTFNFYIAIDPAIWFDNHLLTRKVKADSTIKRNYESSLYISAANNSSAPIDTSGFRKAIDKFYSALKANSTSELNSKLQYFEKEDHGSVPLLSLYHGLEFCFEGFYLSNVYDQDISVINEHYENLSKKLGLKLLPPEELINNIGHYHFNFTKDRDKAMKFFAFNTQLYPDSYNVYDVQAEAYKVMGNTKKAIEYYNKSLKLNPNNKDTIKILKELMDKSNK